MKYKKIHMKYDPHFKQLLLHCVTVHKFRIIQNNETNNLRTFYLKCQCQEKKKIK